MPAVVSPRFLTPPQVAKRLGIDSHRVIRWIKSGQLAACNVGDGAQRPRFRVFESDLTIFLASRAAGPTPKVSRRQKRNPEITEFF